MGRLDGKVAFITGAARGQGRSHAVRLAEEGAAVVAVDLCEQIATVPYALATPADLAETARQVQERGGRVVTARADVRDAGQLRAAVEEGVSRFGHIDVVCANAGIISYGPASDLDEQAWRDVLDVNLTGAWQTCKAVVPEMIRAGRGGSIIMTSSTAGLKGLTNLAHYAAAKHGVVGLARTLANELAPHGIRVNTVHPTAVDTDMVANAATFALFRPDLDDPAREHLEELMREMHALPVALLETREVSNAVLWLASDEARYVTGVALPVDAGFLQR